MNTALDRAWHRLNPAPCSAPGCVCREPQPYEPPATLRSVLAFYGCIAALVFFWARVLLA